MFYICRPSSKGVSQMEDTSFAIPVTPKQIAYARSLALRNQSLLPWEVQQDRRALSSWIDVQARLKPVCPRPAAVVETGRLCRASRPHQTARRSGRVLPRQGHDVEMDRREQVNDKPVGEVLSRGPKLLGHIRMTNLLPPTYRLARRPNLPRDRFARAVLQEVSPRQTPAQGEPFM